MSAGGASARPARRGLRSLARAAMIGASVVLVLLIVAFSLQRYVLFPRHVTRPDPRAGAGVPGLERLWINTVEGRVEAWLIRAPRPGRAPAVIFGHGNGELIDDWPAMLAPYRRLGLHVLLPEYRGYGRSAGSPSQAAITADFVRFHDMLAARADINRRRIVFHGRSLGGGAVCALARHRRPAALILMSTFTGVRPLARRMLFPGFLVRDPFDNLAVVSRYDGPVLVSHGQRDGVIPFSHGQALARAAAHAKLISYPDVGHNVGPGALPGYWHQVGAFLRAAGIISTGGDAASQPQTQ